jgi:putative flippase GtrA
MSERFAGIFRTRLFRYIVSGGVSFAVENLTFLLLYYPLSLEVKVSNVVSICIALIVNFVISKYFVFQNSSDRHSSIVQFLQYAALVVVNMTISTIAVSQLVYAGLPGFIAKPLITIIIAGWTYIVYRKLIFSAKS